MAPSERMGCNDEMADESPYQVPLSDLMKVKVPEEDQVEEQEPAPPAPDLYTEGEKRRNDALQSGG